MGRDCERGRLGTARLDVFVLVAGLLLAVGSGIFAWRSGGPYGERWRQDGVRRVYDERTGRLEVVIFDSTRDGRLDTWAYMDGPRVARLERDVDGNRAIDRWLYFGEDDELEKVGFSTRQDGQVDAWAYPGADGTAVRIEYSGRRDGAISRIEHYEDGALVRAEEDTSGDGSMDSRFDYPRPGPARVR